MHQNWIWLAWLVGCSGIPAPPSTSTAAGVAGAFSGGTGSGDLAIGGASAGSLGGSSPSGGGGTGGASTGAGGANAGATAHTATGGNGGQACPAAGTPCDAGLVCSDYGCINPWAMPNTPGLGLPNPRSYDTTQSGVVIDRVTGLMWQATAGSTALLQTEAATYCDGLTLAGFADWRVPTRLELMTIVEYGAANPALDATAFTATEPSAWFMTANHYVTDVWLVDFALGEASQLESNRGLARCVRSTVNATAPTPRFVVNSNGTVYDQRTRLTWQQDIGQQSGAMSWAFTYLDATLYCASLDLAGGSFRLPSMNELMTIMDDTKENPALDDVTFPTDYGACLVSGTRLLTDSTSVWYTDLVYGMARHAGESNNFDVRCVR